jgi:YVTN family beta-propeller protein
MAPRESSSTRAAWASRRVIIAGVAAVALAAAGTATALAVHGSGAGSHAAGSHAAAKAQVIDESCKGPTGAAYIALPGYQAFDAVNTDNCYVVQQYNVGDPLVPSSVSGPGITDFNYSSTNEGLAEYGNNLYFADTGNDTLAVIDTANLNYNNYENPEETVLGVGQDPEGVAVTPDGSQVWVTDTGPETGGASLGGITVVSANEVSPASDTVIATLSLPTDPRELAFSPSGATAYVTTSRGLLVINTATRQVVDTIPGLGDPEDVAVSPDGNTVYVTNTIQGVVDVISAATNTVTRTIKVGELPWGLVLSADGSTMYVADGDSDAISVINTASDTVTATIPDAGDPVSVSLTPDGSRLWVGGLTSGMVTVFNTADNSLDGSFDVGYNEEANSGDGEEPTAIVMTTTVTSGGS